MSFLFLKNTEKNNPPKEEKKDMFQKIALSKSKRGKTFHFNKLNPEKQDNGIGTLKNSKIEITEFSQNLLKISKYNYFYLLDIKKYGINEIMMLLDLQKITKIQEIFVEYPEGIEKIIFIKRLKKLIEVDNMDLPNLIYGLYKFFCEIDFNGDGHMQWEEFTQFIIDTVEGDSEAKNVNDKENKKIYNEKIMMKYKRYQLCKYLKDSHLYKNEINCAVFIPRTDLIVMNEYGSRFLKLYNPFSGKRSKFLDIEEYLNPNSNKKKESKNKMKTKLNNSLIISNNEKQQEKNSIYRVLFITRYQSLIAICLSDKRIIFLNFETDNGIELLYEITLPILEKRIWFLKYHNIWVTSGSKLPDFDFFTLNELDIELQNDGQKYEFLYNEGHPYRMHYTTKSSFHLSEILDCIEIMKPLLVLTACMDGKIRLISIETQNVLKIWNYHKLGVRQLDYNPYLDGGYILSVGFEYFINLYNLEYSLEDAYKGKLEGSFSSIVSCQFISDSYMAISVDEEGNIRIWNIKTKICVQLIPQIMKKCKINNLLIIPKYNKFIIYGNRIIYYESQYKTLNNKEENNKEDNYPIKVLYNYYYQNFYIATFRDIRVYTNKGKLIKIFKKLNPENFDPDVKIKDFIFENNYRKIYVGFSNGAILQFNAGNGSLIKSVNENINGKEKGDEYTHNKDISGLYFYSRPNDENLLISTSFDSLINVSYEKNPEKSEQIKTIKGAHSNNNKFYEIICMDFSEYLNVFATSGSDGLILLWDFEMSKIIDILLINNNISFKLMTNYLKFLDPFPVLAAAISDGTFYLFEIYKKPYKSKCILRSRNYYKISSKIDICNIECINIFFGNLPSLKKDIDIICLKKYFDKDSPFVKKINNFKNEKDNKEVKKQENSNIKEKNGNGIENNINEAKENLDIVPDIFNDEIIDEDLNRYDNQEELVDNSEIKLKYYIIIGDTNGFLKIIDIYPLFLKLKLNPIEKQEIKSTLNLYKKEEINSSITVRYLLGRIQDSNLVLPSYLNMYYNNLIIFEKKIHHEKITSIEIIKEPLSLVTCSKDNFLKIFNFKCDCIGIINILPKMSKYNIENIKWNFKVDERKILEKEIKEVIEIFEKIGVEPIMIGSDLDEEIKRKTREEYNEKNIEKKIIKKKKEIKKRFKPIVKIKEEKNTEESEEESEKENEYMVAERYFVKSSQNQIEKTLNGTDNNNGIVEITNQLIDITLEKEKIKEKEKKEFIIKNEKNFSENDELNATYSSKKKDNSISKKNIKKIFSLNDIKRIKEIRDENKSNILQIKNKSKFHTNTDLININKSRIDNILSIKNIFLNNDSLNQEKKDALTPRNSDITKIKFPAFSPNKKSSMLSDKNIKKKEEYKKIKKIEIKKQKKINIPQLKKRKIEYNLGNDLLTTRLFKKDSKNELDQNNSRCFSFEKTMNKFNNKILPNLYNKIIFKKGETEKLLNYQFYNSAYKACCEPTKQDGINNIPIKTNYRNNWKLVKQYAHNAKGKYKNNMKENKQKISEKIISYLNTNYKTSLPTEQKN